MARLISRANRYSAVAWKAYPLTKELRLTDDETRFMVAYATGCPWESLAKDCTCGAELTLEHLVCCRFGGEKLHRHNMVQHRFAAFAHEQGMAVRQNVRQTIDDAVEMRKRQEPDIIFYPGISKPLETDITVVNPCCPSKIRHTLNKPNWATHDAGARKRGKYEHTARLRGNDFAPLVFETHGNRGKEVDDLLFKLADSSTGSKAWVARDMALDLAVTLVRGNAHCARMRSRLAKSRELALLGPRVDS